MCLALRSSCAWHRFWSPWSNASDWLMQTGDKHSAVPGGADASKSELPSSCAWHQFWCRWDNASHCLMPPEDRHSAVPGGADASKRVLRSSCAWHQFWSRKIEWQHSPGTKAACQYPRSGPNDLGVDNATIAAFDRDREFVPGRLVRSFN